MKNKQGQTSMTKLSAANYTQTELKFITKTNIKYYN